MYSGVYLFLKVVEKNIFLNKKVMECIFEYTLTTLTTFRKSVKKMTSLLWRSNQSLTNLKPMALGNPLRTIATSPVNFESIPSC